MREPGIHATGIPSQEVVGRPTVTVAPLLPDALPVVLDALCQVDPAQHQELLDTLAMCVRYGHDSYRARLAEMLSGKRRDAA